MANNHPFTIVEEQPFIDLIASLNPDFQLPSASTVKNWVMSTYVENKVKVKETLALDGNGKPSATTDLWTSGNHHGVLAVTVTWLDANFEMKEIVLGFRKLKGEHSGANIAFAFSKVLEEYGILNRVSNNPQLVPADLC